jgi:hypothetical protein
MRNATPGELYRRSRLYLVSGEQDLLPDAPLLEGGGL